MGLELVLGLGLWIGGLKLGLGLGLVLGLSLGKGLGLVLVIGLGLLLGLVFRIGLGGLVLLLRLVLWLKLGLEMRGQPGHLHHAGGRESSLRICRFGCCGCFRR